MIAFTSLGLVAVVQKWVLSVSRHCTIENDAELRQYLRVGPVVCVAQSSTVKQAWTTCHQASSHALPTQQISHWATIMMHSTSLYVDSWTASSADMSTTVSVRAHLMISLYTFEKTFKAFFVLIALVHVLFSFFDCLCAHVFTGFMHEVNVR